MRSKRFSITFILFVLLPFSILWFLSDSFLSRIEEAGLQKLLRKMRYDFIQIIGWTDVSGRISRDLQKLTRKFQTREWLPEKFLERKSSFEKSWGFSFDAYFWGPTGSLETPKRFQCRGRNAISKYWRLLRVGDRSGIESSLPLIKTFFGEPWRMAEWSRGSLWKFQGVGIKGCLFWDIDPYSELGGSLFIVWNIPGQDTFLENQIRRRKNFPYSVLVRDENGDLRPLNSKLSAPEEREVPSQFQLQRAPWILQNGKLWLTKNVEGLDFYFGFPLEQAGMLFAKRVVRALILGLGFLMFVLLFRWMILGREIAISIRLKLMFLFSYAMALPLMGLLVIGFRAYQDYYAGMLEDVRQTGLELIKNIDDGFQREPQILGKKIGRFKRLFDDPSRIGNFEKFAYYGKKRDLFGGMELKDTEARTIMRFGDTLLQDAILEKVMHGVAIEAILRHLPDRSPPGLEKPKPGLDDFFIRSLIESSDVGLSKIANLPKVFHRLLFPKKDVFFYWDYFPRKDHPAAMLICGQLSLFAKERYLRGIMSTQRQLLQKGYRLVMVNETGNRWYPFEFSRSRTLKLFSRHMFLTQERILENTIWKGNPWIVTGMPGRLIPEYAYMVLYPESMIRIRLNRFVNFAALGTLLAVIITLLLGWTLADTFLVPIAELGLGISALKEQRLNFRLPQLGLDEFGDLSVAFNELMETLKEMSAGKLVQEQLFPKTTLDAGSFRIRGLSRPATNLGGDYFDYGKVGTNNFFVLIGDVAGHGIPAALIMAMARAVVTNFIRRGETSPQKLLEELQQTVYSSMLGKRFMTAALLWGTCNPPEIQYFNCGHPYLLHLKNKNESKYVIQVGGTPIGTTRFTVKPPQLLKPEPGERLILYTDGLVESIPTLDGMDSFEVFRKYVQNNPWWAGPPTWARPPEGGSENTRRGLPQEGSLEQNCKTLLENHPFYKTGEPQPDDFTIVILDRLSD